MLVVY